ncbi:sulfatase [Chitinophaga caseinilytica]|uniref:sulfatase n=1 Tax=Chitinophaga caseinilytica TaxID=2267521 RepID=UPI003C2CE374
MKLLNITLLAGLLLPAMAQAQQRPNIIVFLVDDMGWMDTSLPLGDSTYPLNKRYHTPNMERLAADGMKFSQAYATPVCTPTRVSLMTGMNAARHRVTNWTSPVKDRPTDRPDDQFGPLDWNINGCSPVAGIPGSVHATPLPQLLRDAGYFTVHVGKAHWGSQGTPGANPYNFGFTVNVGGHAAGHPQSYQGKENYGNLPGKASAQAVPDLEEYWGTETFLTEALTVEAIKSIETPVKTKQPFFLHLGHYAVHDPIQGDKRFLQRYLDAGLDTIEARYASLLEGMDKSLGDIMDYLRKKNIDKQTVIIFMSDNGGLSYSPPRGGPSHTQNLPLKAGKGSMYEGGIREPMIVKWPGVTKAGSMTKQYVMIEDFFPTILAMAGVRQYKTVQPVDGRSFVNVLQNPRSADSTRALVWHFPNKWQPQDGPGINYKSAVRQGRWKMIYNMRDGKKELYDIEADLRESNDLSAVNPAKVKALSALLSDRLREWKAQMPPLKNSGKAAPFPDETE